MGVVPRSGGAAGYCRWATDSTRLRAV